MRSPRSADAMEASPDGAAPADTSGSDNYKPMSREAMYAETPRPTS
jgi:hypothetical protein